MASPNPSTARVFVCLFMRLRSAYIFVALAACFSVTLFDYVLIFLPFVAKRLPTMCLNLAQIM